MQIMRAEADKKTAELAQKMQDSPRKKHRPKRTPTNSSSGSTRKKD
jgi:hypothetical protein